MAGIHDADRYSDLKVDLNCPVCGTSGLIPVKSLDRVLYCTRCAAQYRVQARSLVVIPPPEHTQLAVQVRTNSSEWREHALMMRHSLSLKARLLDFAWEGHARWIVAGALCCLVLLAINLSRGPAPPRPVELPVALEERAALLAEAIAQRDMERTMALTLPPQHRRMRSWLGHECPIKAPAAGEEVSPAKADVLGVSQGVGVADHTDVRVQVSGLPSGRLTMVQMWVQFEDVWYFQPPASRQATIQPVTAAPYSKPTRGGPRR